MSVAASSNPSGISIKQWVERVTGFSSEYTATGWCANRVIGPPNVYPNYGDNQNAWTSKVIDNNQFLELHYKEAVYLKQINIYETFNAGAVKRVKARQNEETDWIVLWETPRPQKIQKSRVFSPPLRDIDTKCSDVRIEVDCSAARTWVEIDAVEIVGVATYLPASPSMEEFSDNLSTLVNNGTFSDVRFAVGDKMVYAHKAILMARSDYFKGMFCDQMKNAVTKDPITLKDVEFEGFYALLHFLYANQIPSSQQSKPTVFAQIWRAADRFSVKCLKTKVAQQVCGDINSENVIDVYCAVTDKQPVINEIRDSCLEYMRGHMSSVVKSSSFVGLEKNTMLGIIQAIFM